VTHFFELTLAGITRGAIYALIALGYTMVYGVVGLINFAHGEIYMLGAFTGLVAAGMFTVFGFSGAAILALAIVLAIVYAAAYGYTVEQVAYRPLRGAPRLSALISAIGMSIFLQNFVLLMQGPEFKPYPNLLEEFGGDDFFSDIDDESQAPLLQVSEWAIVSAAAISMAALFALIKFTRIGRAMRAVAQDREMAALSGVNVNRTISAAFVVGSMFAAVGGVLVANHVGQINFYFGFIAGIKAFTAAVLGGIGSIPGAALGGIVLGLAESFAAGYVASDYEDVIAFSLLVVILIFKPEGLLGKTAAVKV
jgi:branched-chain amino acid transport system permease protein